jgi:Protein of unknown function (DUF2384)
MPEVSMRSKHRSKRLRRRTTSSEVESLVQKLAHEDEAVRLRALSALSSCAEVPSAILAVVAALNDTGNDLRYRAWQTLLSLCPEAEKLPREVVAGLQSDDSQVRLDVIRKLVTLLPGVGEALAARKLGWQALESLTRRAPEGQTGGSPGPLPEEPPATGAEYESVTEDPMPRSRKTKPRQPLDRAREGRRAATPSAGELTPPGGEDPVAEAMREHPGRWLAWKRKRTGRAVLAIADDYAGLMKQVADPADPGLVVEVAPGLHPLAATRRFELLDDESPNVLDDVKKYWGDAAEQWLDSSNAWFDGRKPRDLIGTEDEEGIRYLIRAIKTGTPA